MSCLLLFLCFRLHWYAHSWRDCLILILLKPSDIQSSFPLSILFSHFFSACTCIVFSIIYFLMTDQWHWIMGNMSHTFFVFMLKLSLTLSWQPDLSPIIKTVMEFLYILNMFYIHISCSAKLCRFLINIANKLF